MPLNTQFAPLSKVFTTVGSTIAATGGLYALFRATWPKAYTWTEEWEGKTREMFSAMPMHAAPSEPTVTNPFSRWRYQ